LSDLNVQTAEAFLPFFNDDGSLKDSRYKGAHGGRGSMKSHFFAERVVLRSWEIPGHRAVCMREVQKTLNESVKRLIEDKIAALDLRHHFRVLQREIRTPGNGIIVFHGMQDHTAESIKSLEGYDLGWFEEAQTCSAKSLRMLRPTIRKDPVGNRPGSELWFSWNPNEPTDPVDHLFRGGNPPPDSICIETNWRDNPWFPNVLKAEMQYDYRVDPEGAAHVWDGQYWIKSDAQVLSGKWRVEEFEPVTEGKGAWKGPYHGADWGFSTDPTAFVRFWLKPDGSLMVEREAYQLGCELNNTPQLFEEQVPDIRHHMIRADSARPETISYMVKTHRFRMEGAPKWQGSVEDGIAWLRARPAIVIHPRCRHTAAEAKLWRYKTDRLTGDVLPVLVDGHDNTWDAIRYGASPMIKVKHTYTLDNIR
jgi:phage terminase large subunit